MRVLVADDDPTYRSLLEGLLTKWNFEVVSAVNGVEAMEAMRRENPPHLVILDWEMPEMDGFEVARTIRNEESGKDAYVLMITSSKKKKEDMMQVLVCGADDYLIKPFDPMDLEIHLRSALRILHLREELDELKRSCQSEAVGLT
ncbi:MAG: response regulator transcription factor [Planctomycetota bacterium]|nr:response regulator transcription factor [Planctomycetota bacterium]